MKTMMKRTLPLLAISVLAMGGGLYVEVGNPEANPEAKKHKATLVARVTACHEPAKSKVVASLVNLEGDRITRTRLKVEPLSTPGVWAVFGAAEGVIEVAVTNPQFGDYQTSTLVRVSREGVRWAGIKRFNGTPPTLADLRAMLTAETALNRP